MIGHYSNGKGPVDSKTKYTLGTGAGDKGHIVNHLLQTRP